ncbi:hypothetical protein LCGC14_1475240 [marine sediment metagenome]|uniref:Uncharacterized protein n=1 Tax=marine sediment metagenome TaxID=412755 RepID=A0A0F9JB54_9ZZZZ
MTAKPHYPRRVQQQILDSRGLDRAGHGRLEPKAKPSTPGATFAMRLMEERFDVPIKELIGHGSNVEVGNMLGLSPSTISKWRLRLGLRL